MSPTARAPQAQTPSGAAGGFVAPPRAGPAVQLGKMLVYFVLIGIGTRVLQQIFVELSNTGYTAGLERVTNLAASLLDVSKNVDDLIVTFFGLATTFLLIVPVAWVHTLTKGDDASPSLTQTLVMVSVIVAGLMMLLEDNLARSFGLVGVVAAMRYRHTIEDPKDAVYVFLSIGIGMACGLQHYFVALLLSVFQCAILLVLWGFRTGAPAKGEGTLLETLRASDQGAFSRLAPEARGRLEGELDALSRYITTASMLLDKKGKRPNCVITVETTGTAAARDAINAQLQDNRGKWRVLTTTDNRGMTTIEYLGRLPREHVPPLSLLERLRTADPGVRHVSFRSLRKLVPAAPEGPPPGHSPAHPSSSGTH
jgi:hypothetical protein